MNANEADICETRQPVRFGNTAVMQPLTLDLLFLNFALETIHWCAHALLFINAA